MPRKKGAPPRDRKHAAQVVALLHSQGVPSEKIAEQIEASSAELSRLKHLAQEEGWLSTICTLPPERQQEIERTLYPYAQLKGKLDDIAKDGAVPKVRRVRIFNSGSDSTDPHEYDERLSRFGRAAAGAFVELVPRMRQVGVTWGKAIDSLAQGLWDLYRETPRGGTPITFVPLCGVLLDDPNVRLSSSNLVAKLHEALNGHAGRLLSMAAVPARLPSRLHFTDEKVTERERQVLTKFIRDTAGYRRIFLDGGESGGQKQRPLIQEMDSIVTSVGSAYQNSGDPWIGEMTSREGITKEQLDRLAVGDIGGVFLPRPDLKGKHPQLEDLNARWTGPKLEHFQRCAKAASGGAAPGVIVLAIGRWKANVICECVRLGLVSELIIDHELARALVQ